MAGRGDVLFVYDSEIRDGLGWLKLATKHSFDDFSKWTAYMSAQGVAVADKSDDFACRPVVIACGVEAARRVHEKLKTAAAFATGEFSVFLAGITSASTLAKKDFEACVEAFELHSRANKVKLDWNAGSPCRAFTDGSCSGNGKPHARAAFAVLFTGSHLDEYVIQGCVASHEYRLVENAEGESEIETNDSHVLPSNNRGELLAIIYAFAGLLAAKIAGPVEIVSDSEISVKTLLEWLPTRLKKNTHHELKNFDLVMIAWHLLCRLRERVPVKVTHVRSHQKEPAASASAEAKAFHRGNKLVDGYAKDAQARRPGAVEVLCVDPSGGALASLVRV